MFDGFVCSEIPKLPNKSFREDVANNEISAMNNRSCYHAENFDFQSLAKWSNIFHFGSSGWYESEGFRKLFGRATAFARPQEQFSYSRPSPSPMAQ